MELAVVVLAGGEGRRIGGGKPVRVLGGERLIDRALRHARQWSGIVAVSLRDPSQADVNAEIILDEAHVAGPLAGVMAGLHLAAERGCGALLTLPTDMPFLPRDLAGRLTAEIGDAAAAIARSGGHLHPVCALWRVETSGAAEAYVANGRRSLKGLADSVGYRAVDWAAEPVDPFYNINESAELAEAERRLRV